MTDAIKERLRGIKEMIAKNPDLLGLKTCFSEAQARRYEQAFGVALPQTYRAFLLNIGNSGKKPHHALCALEQRNKRFHLFEHRLNN